MFRHGIDRAHRETPRRRSLTAVALAAVIALPMVLVQSTAVHVAAAATTYDLRLDVFAEHDSSLRPNRGDDSCAPYAGMRLLHPFESGTVTGLALPNPPSGPTQTCGSPPAPYTYKWIINADNAGDPHQPSYDDGDAVAEGTDICRPVSTNNVDGNANFPVGCNWPSIHTADASPVVTQGDYTEWNVGGGALTDAIHNLPDGKYLVSVSADGFEIGGAHFQIPMPSVTGGAPSFIHVPLNPYPLPLGTIQVQVFEDNAPADGTFDTTTEHGLAGWNATVNDILGQVSTDWFVNPICTEYQRMVPAGLLALPGPNPSSNTMGPTEALTYYGNGIDPAHPVHGPGFADAVTFYGGGDPGYVFNYADYLTWGIFLDDTASPVRIPGTGGKCLSDANGIVRVPNMGTNRYSITVAPPGDSDNENRWRETTTLEGGPDSDFWMMANDTGLDTELVQAGEPVPWAQFGFVDTKNDDTDPSTPGLNPQPWPITDPATHTGGAHITGTVMAAEPYVPGQGGLAGQGGANGQSGIRYPHTLDRVMIGLNDFDNGDLLGYVTQNEDDGTFDISNIKDGTYLISFWDIDQDYAFDVFNVSIVGGKSIDLGNVPLIGWFTNVSGKVFVDTNANGRLDPGEKGVPNFDVTIKQRRNDLIVSGQNVATSDLGGNYHFKEAYPAGSFVIEEFFNTRYKTTGVTYQADNDPQEHTITTAAVDLSLLPIIGQDGRVDIGVLPYDTSANPCDDTCQGGIVATVVYDATRNELLPRKAATEDYENGIPNIPVEIARPVPCAGPTDTCDVTRHIHLNDDGTAAVGAPLNVGDDPATADVAPGNTGDPNSATYITEEWHRPANCIPRDSNGNPVQQDALPYTHANRQPQDCVEATELATTFGFADGDDPVNAADGQQVDGNYGFVTWHPGDYLVSVNLTSPENTDPVFHRPLYKARTAEPINVFTGDVYVPQGANLNGITFDSFLKANRGDPLVPQMSEQGHGLREAPSTSTPDPTAECVGPWVTVDANTPGTDTYNPDLHNVGGSPYEGIKVHDCSVKLIHVEAGQSVAPNFSLWTDVPIPSKYWGYVTDDVSVSTDRRSTSLGEVQGVADIPVGLYDWTNRLLTTVDTDYNGLFEVLMPSTNSYNCPVPAGPCSGMYRFVGNDPGQPQHPNLNYKPIYRTIAAAFQAWPGAFTFADTAPTRATVQIEGPGSQFAAAVVCKAEDVEPQLFKVDWPFVPNPNGSITDATGTINVYGLGFRGGTAGNSTTGTVTLTSDSNTYTIHPTIWTDTHIQLVIPANVAGGAYLLQVTQPPTDGGHATVNGLTIHVLKTGYTTVAGSRNVNTTIGSPANVLNSSTSVFTPADVGASITGSRIPANTRIATYVNPRRVTLTANATSGSNGATNRTINPDTFGTRFPDVVHVGPLTTLQHLDSAVADQAPNAPYTNWSETNRSNMFTPIDANNFYFPGPIQKAVNYGFDRYLNVSPANVNTANNNFAPDDPARSAFLQSRRGTARHPLIIVHPRFDATLDGNGLPTVPNFDVNDPTLVFNANGAYYESPVLFYPGKIQGSGPGGIYAPPVGSTDPLPVFGSVVDGQYFNAATNKPEPTTSDQADGTDPFTYDPSLFAEPYAALWENFVVFQLGQGATPADPTIPQPLTPLASWYGYGWDGQQAPTEGEVLYVVAHEDDYTSSYKAAIDGLTITGGDQKGFPGNRNEVGGGRIANAPGETGTAPDENFVLDIQGGAIMVNAFARYLQLTNNSVIANSGASGAIRIGTPQLGTDTEDGNPETDPATGETFPTFDQENTNLRLAFNRITANGGTSLGGALAIFNGSHNYRVDHNEFCGNFSAEYGGAISHFGLSKNGEIDHNKVYLNESVDEGAGVMIAGEPHLDPAVAIPIPNKLSNGSGPVTIHDNYIASNLAGDDGGGIRFLQSGTWQADVYNNMITDNVSTHEGGGIALDDATNVRIVNDSIAKNLTTATAVTSLGAPAPAGLSTGDNSSPLMACSVDNLNDALGHNRHGTGGQIRTGNFVFTRNGFFTQDDVGATLVANFVPAGAQIVSVSANGNSATLSVAATGSGNQNHPNLAFDVYRDCSGMPPQPTGASPFANPLIFNDIFEDNRSGNWQTTGTNYGVNGIGLFTDEAIYHWDMGLADGPGTLSPHYSIINDDDGNGFTDDGTNQLHNELIGGPTHVPYVSDAQFQSPFDIKVSVSPWRVNPRFRPTSILGVSLPANAIGDYHIVRGSPAQDAGVTQYPPLPATAVATAPTSDIDADGRSNPDEGADEIPPPSADLSITKTDNVTDVTPGQALTYTVVVTDNGPDAVTAAPVTDTFPAGLTVSSWTCIATAGSSCTTGGSGSNRTGTVSLLNGGSATFTANATVNTTTPPATIPAPSFTGTQPLDNFNRSNVNNLNSGAPSGVSWNEPAILGAAAIQVNNNQANDVVTSSQAIFNGSRNSGPNFGARQAAALTFANAPQTGTGLILKATGGSAGLLCTPLLSVCQPNNMIRAVYSSSQQSLANIASVAVPAGTIDTNTGNNSATDSDTLSVNQINVESTTNGGSSYTSRGSFPVTLATGDVLTAQVSVLVTPANTIHVDVWKTTGATTTYLGQASFVSSTFAGTGRVGMQMPLGARVDDFKGGTI